MRACVEYALVGSLESQTGSLRHRRVGGETFEEGQLAAAPALLPLLSYRLDLPNSYTNSPVTSTTYSTPAHHVHPLPAGLHRFPRLGRALEVQRDLLWSNLGLLREVLLGRRQASLHCTVCCQTLYVICHRESSIRG